MQPPELTIILVVEHNEADAEHLLHSLANLQRPYRLERVSSSEAAIDYLSGAGPYADRERFPFPALVLLDMQLPQTSGSDLLDWLKQHQDLNPMLVLILSNGSLAYTGKSMETHGNVTISYLPFLKPLGREIVAAMHDLFEVWNAISKQLVGVPAT
ncbi:MAG: response regulator receiver protein [Verrucomicrobiales bacterium]|nr:response regulator receiver protein [Verrucomicrobiales bacterium]